MERDRIAQELKAKLSRGRFARPRSPAWTVSEDFLTVSTPSGRTVSRINYFEYGTKNIAVRESSQSLQNAFTEFKDASSCLFV